MEKTKISLRINTELLDRFKSDLQTCFLKRDAFLEHLIRSETPYLAQDLEGKRMSDQAKRYVSRKLKQMGTKVINVVVEKDTVGALDEVVEKTNIVRDAFVNTLLLFVRSNDKLLKRFDLPSRINGSAFDAVVEQMPTSPILAIREVMADPFYYLRTAVEERHECGLYTFQLPEEFHGFTCYLPDNDVPGTQAYREEQERSELMLAELDVLLEKALTPDGGAK